jgi:hypothetical protein
MAHRWGLLPVLGPPGRWSAPVAGTPAPGAGRPVAPHGGGHQLQVARWPTGLYLAVATTAAVVDCLDSLVNLA